MLMRDDTEWRQPDGLASRRSRYLARQPFSPVANKIVSEKPGNTVSHRYVLAFVNELPTQGVPVDWVVKPREARRWGTRLPETQR